MTGTTLYVDGGLAHSPAAAAPRPPAATHQPHHMTPKGAS